MGFINEQLCAAVYCINLLASVQRRKNMERHFAASGITAEFLVGITPSSPLFQRWIHPTSNLVQRGIVKRCFCQPAIAASGRCDHRPRALRNSEIAISLSHRQAYVQCVERGQDLIMVCEDDIVFHARLEKILERLLTPFLQLLRDSGRPSIIFLGKPNNPGLAIEGLDAYRLEATAGLYSNYCYLINRAACEVLLQHFFPINRPEDSYKRFQIGTGHIRAWVVTPGLVGEQSAGMNMRAIYQRLSILPDAPAFAGQGKAGRDPVNDQAPHFPSGGRRAIRRRPLRRNRGMPLISTVSTAAAANAIDSRYLPPGHGSDLSTDATKEGGESPAPRRLIHYHRSLSTKN